MSQIMPKSKIMLERYRDDFGSGGKTKSISEQQLPHLKRWIEQELGIKIELNFFVSMGKGGGQTYKTLYNVFDIHGNAGKRCVFFNENARAVTELIENNHVPLEEVIEASENGFKTYR